MAILVACPPPVLQFFDNSGKPAVNGSVLTQVGGVNTPTYADSAGITPLPNPIPLNSRGEVSDSSGTTRQIFLTPNTAYQFALFDANGNQIWSQQYINGTQNTTGSIGSLLYPQTPAEAVAGITPTLYQYPEGDIRRYGALTANADNHAPITTALAVSGAGGSAAYLPPGTWNITSSVTVAALSSLYGAGNASILMCNSCDGLTFSADPGILPFTRFFRDFQIIGTGSGPWTTQNFHAIFINLTVGSAVSACLFQNIGVRNFGWMAYIQGLEDSSFIGCQGYNNYYGFFFFQQSATEALTDCIIQRGSIGAPAGGLGTGAIGVVLTGTPEQENLHLTNCSIYGYDHLVDIALCFELQINSCDLSNAQSIGIALGSSLGPVVIRDNWIETNSASAVVGINVPSVTPTINTKVVIEGNYLRNDIPFAGSVGINIGNNNAGIVVKSNHMIQYDKGIALGASVGVCVKHNTIDITQGNTAFSANSVALSVNSLSVDNEIGPNYIISGVLDAVTMSNASTNLLVGPARYPVGTPIQFDAAVNGFFTGVTYYVVGIGGNFIQAGAAPGGAAIAATGNAAVNVFQAPLPITYTAGIPPGLQLYARGSFLGGVTGFSPAVTPQPVDWVANGYSVTLNVRNASNLLGTSNATTMTMINVPPMLYPITTQGFLCDVQDNSAGFQYGFASINSAGVFNFFKSPASTPFTAAGTKGVNTMPMTWLFT
jgi:hypothetical protein